MHGPYDVRPADQLVADVYNQLRSNDVVWNKSVLIITMDEHGGFYDHVVPPAAPNPDGIDASNFQFDRLGVRVPAVIASPWIPAGTVDSTSYQHTSILATLKNLYGLANSLTKRDASANAFDKLFSEATPRTDTPQTIAGAPHVPTPRTFATGTPVDHSCFGLDSLQQEMVHGVDVLTQPDSSKLLSLAGLPQTQGEAADFIRRRIQNAFGP
ncbi:MAG: non-specific phospholipase [Chthonomonadales bacterium]|nr:non-specific phospholipase [Chthonomonadales bacterium]